MTTRFDAVLCGVALVAAMTGIAFGITAQESVDSVRLEAELLQVKAALVDAQTQLAQCRAQLVAPALQREREALEKRAGCPGTFDWTKYACAEKK